MKRKTRGIDLILGIELVHKAPHKTKANVKVFQLRGEQGKEGGRERLERKKRKQGRKKTEKK